MQRISEMEKIQAFQHGDKEKLASRLLREGIWSPKWKHPEEIRFLKTTDMLVKMIAELDGAAPWKDIRKTPEGIEDEVINNFSASRQKDNYHSTIDAFYFSGNEHGIRKLV